MGLFRRTKGVHPPENKITEDKPIEAAKLPSVAYMSVSQHLGAPCKAVVKRGDTLKTGQVIAEPSAFVSTFLHSPVSGKVKKVTQTIHPIVGKPVDVVVIESDGKDEWVELKKTKNLDSLSQDEVLDKIKEAGIVGLGGATFPTHIKLKPPPGKHVDTIILNGCECEPWITSDNRMMLEYGKEILSGLKVMLKALPVDNVHLAIERNKPEAIDHMQRLISKMDFGTPVKVSPMKTRYPQGAEKTLTKNLLDREVPIGALPFEVGVLVQNVSTVKAIHDAIFEGKPLIERAMTVTGMVNDPKNLMVRFGTTIDDILENVNGIKGDADQLIFGGPMMGITQYSPRTPVVKGTNCLLVKKKDPRPEGECIRCARCVNSCPMELMPTMYVKLVKARKWEECMDYWIENCVECGCCAYSCPANIPIVQYIKLGKAEVAKMRKKK